MTAASFGVFSRLLRACRPKSSYLRLYYLAWKYSFFSYFFFQAEDGIRDPLVTGVQTCALPIFFSRRQLRLDNLLDLSFFDHGIILRECAGAGDIDQRDHHIKCHQQGHCLETAGGREGRRVQQDKDAGPEESIEDEHDLKHRGEVEEIPGRQP